MFEEMKMLHSMTLSLICVCMIIKRHDGDERWLSLAVSNLIVTFNDTNTDKIICIYYLYTWSV